MRLRGWLSSARGTGRFRRLQRPLDDGQEAGLLALFQSVAVAPDIDRGRVMQETIEDGGRDVRIAEDRAPVPIALVAAQDNAAALVAGADQLEEDHGAQVVQRQVAHLIDHQDLGRQVDAKAAVQAAFPIRAPEIGNQVMRGDEVRAEARLNRLDGEGDTEMRLAHPGRAQEDDVAGIVDKPQGAQLADLALVDILGMAIAVVLIIHGVVLWRLVGKS